MTKTTKQGVTVYRTDRFGAVIYSLLTVVPIIAIGVVLFLSFDETVVRVGVTIGVVFFVLLFFVIFDVFGRGVIEIDRNEQVVRFRHFVYPLHFGDIRRKRLVEISFNEIAQVKFISIPKGTDQIRVYTSRSRFIVSEHFGHIDELRGDLSAVSSSNNINDSASQKSDRTFNRVVIVICATIVLAAVVYYFGWINPLF